MIASVEKVLENIKVCENIYKIAVEGRFEGKPGQFYMLKAPFDEPILPRPISIYNLEDDRIEFLYRTAGKGTKLIADLKEGDMLQIMGPLGNGFDVQNTKGKIAVVSGGIGTAPMCYFAKHLKSCSMDFYGGFKDIVYGLDLIIENAENVNITLESSTKDADLNLNKYSTKLQDKINIVEKSFVTDILDVTKYDMVFTCGPKIMMKKVVDMCSRNNVKVMVSMENRMACGIGACLGCTCSTKDGFKRVCNDGPVFNGEDLIWDE